jgi:hypothetical protein
MTILEMIEEWRKGCSIAGPDNLHECGHCSEALLDIIEKKLKRESCETKYMLIDSYHYDRSKPNLAEDDSRGHFGPFDTPEEAEAYARKEWPKGWHAMWVQTLHPVGEYNWEDDNE